MSLKRLLGSIAMVAAPFVAPQISSFLGLSDLMGATAGSALTGAALGGIGSAVGGYSPLTGMALGGIGGGLAGYYGQPATPAPQATGPGASPVLNGTITEAAAPTSLPTVTAPPGSAGTSADLTMLERMRRGVQSAPFWQGAAQLALAAANAPPTGLTGAEQAVAAEAARNAATSRALIDQKREMFNRELQSTGFSPERAYSQAQMTTQRALADIQRGRPEEQQAGAARRAAIEGARLGTAAVGEGAAQAQRTRAGLIGQMPTDVPIGPAGVTLPLYQAAEKRQSAYDEAIGRSAGLMAGGLSGAEMYRPYDNSPR